MALSSPSLTLSMGGVDFCLCPSDAAAMMKYHQTSPDKKIVLELTNFSGSLIITPNQTATPTASSDEEAVKVTPKLSYPGNFQKKHHLAPLQEMLQDSDDDLYGEINEEHPSQSTPVKKRKIDDPASSSEAGEQQFDAEVPPQDRGKEEEDNDGIPSQTQDTLLGQFSQTQGSSFMSQEEEDEENDCGKLECSNDSSEQVKSFGNEAMEPLKPVEEAAAEPIEQDDTSTANNEVTSQKGTMEPSVPTHALPKKENQSLPGAATALPSDPSSTASTKEKDEAAAAQVSRRVSIGSPEKEAKPVQPPPTERWGHTVTAINGNRFIVYGGQNINPKSRLPQTLNDLYVYDMNKKVWFKPFSGDGLPRQWHTSTFLPDRQLLLSFGGESHHPKTGKPRTFSNVTVLDTELMVWYPASVSGEVPTGRSGHAAAMMEQDLVIFGGVKGSKWLNTVAVLNTSSWVWRQIKIQGSSPKPRSYPSATAVGTNRIVIFGGNNEKEAFSTVHVLEKMDGDNWQWTHPMVTGYGPCPRTGHSATLLSDGHTICIYGGWDPNEDNDEVKDDDSTTIFNDAFLLDTQTWQWKKMGVSLSKRVGHDVVVQEKEGDAGTQLIAFGGRIPQDRFTNDMEMFNASLH